MKNEIWESIQGLSRYQVSNYGRVRRSDGEQKQGGGYIINQRLNRDGYKIVCISEFGIRHNYRVHRLVCQAFNGDPNPPKTHVAHADGTRTNNYYKNLRWVTAKENARDCIEHGRSLRGTRHHQAVLNEKQVIGIYNRRLAGEPEKMVAKNYKISTTTVGRIWRDESWGHLTRAI